MLTLAGLGIIGEGDISLRSAEEAKKSDKVYIEFYTSMWHGDLEKLKHIVGKEIFQLQRKDLEESSEKILQEAMEKNILIFVPGDPMVATTHSALILEARKRDIRTKIIHNSSIISAIAESGLHIYKFGPTVTIPFLEKTKGILPKSVYDTVRENKQRGLHTLCLLDVLDDSSMTPSEGIDMINKMEEKFAENVMSGSEKIVIYHSSENPKMFFDTLNNLAAKKIPETPSVIVLLGKLHFTEKEFLEVCSQV